MNKKIVKVLESIMEHLDRAEMTGDTNSYEIDTATFDTAYGMLKALITLLEDDEND